MNKKLILFIFAILGIATTELLSQTFVNDFHGNFRSRGLIKTDSGLYYFGDGMRLYGNDNSALYFKSNHSSVTQLFFRDKENVNYGKLLGSSDGAYFGIADADGDWTLRQAKDLFTSFSIDNSEKLRILANGNVGIGTISPTNTIHVNGTSRITDKSFFGTVTDDGDANYNVYSEKGILAKGALRTDNRAVYFGPNLKLSANATSALSWTTNHSSHTQMLFRDKENEIYGSINGSGNGANFGLLDGDSNWSLLAVKDDYTSFFINNSEKMRILASGNVGIGISSPTNTLHVGGSSRIDGKSFFGNVSDDGSTAYNVYSEKGILAKGNLRTDNRILFFGSDQYLAGDGGVALVYRSNHSTYTQLIFKDKEDVTYGRIAGSGNGSNFGLLDADGHWAMQIVKDDHTAFRINNSEKMRIKSNGNVGIGTATPTNKLHVNGATRITGKTYIGNVDDEPTNVDYKLFVEKGILTESVRVAVKNSSEWADYVFEEEHKLTPIEEVNQFITENKHLPNVPSADKIVEEGIDVAKMDAILLRQIEELWLHVIDLKEENVELKEENRLIKKLVLDQKKEANKN